MSDVAIVASATGAAPRDYPIPGAQEVLPKSVSASMDGSGAAAAWFPCLQVLDPSGRAMFSAVATSSVAAGASADVSWFPRVGSAAGIRFDTFPQDGDWLYVKTTSGGSPDGWGYEFIDSGTNGGFLLKETGTGSSLNFQSLGAVGIGDGGDENHVGNVDFNVSFGRDINLRTEPNLNYANTGRDINLSAATEVNIASGTSGAASSTNITAKNSGDVTIGTEGGGGNVIMGTLPLADPGVSGALWNSAGTVKVSP